MIAVHLEPKGLRPDARPLVTGDRITRREEATYGSRRLLEAILNAHRRTIGPAPVPVFKAAPRKRGRKPPKRLPQALRIIALVAENASLTVEALTGRDQCRDTTAPRHVAMYLIRLTTGSSYPGIGAYFGGKHHTTIMHGVREVQKRIGAHDEETIAALRFVHERLGKAAA